MSALARPARIALVGDRSPDVLAHGRIPTVIRQLSRGPAGPVDADWRHSSQIGAGDSLADYDGIWVVPGSPYADVDGVLTAITYARTRRVPLLGTCGGFQHLLLEFARNVCGRTDAAHAEDSPDADDLLLVPLACALLDAEDAVTIAPHTIAAAIMGAGRRTERFFCSYGMDLGYVPTLEDGGLRISGHDDTGMVRVAELPDHPFFFGTLFQPELASGDEWVHPVIHAFAAAAREHHGRSAR